METIQRAFIDTPSRAIIDDTLHEIGFTVRKRGSIAGGINPLNKTLRVLFEAFDKTGTGEIHLKELYEELSTIPGVEIDHKALDRLQRQFKYMDKNGDGSVTFDEFEKAATVALSRDFSTLEQEKACQDFGYELFNLFAQYRRQQLAGIMKSNAMSEFEKLKNMQKLAIFTLDMMDQERRKNTAQEEIMRKTTTFSQRRSKALLEEKTAVLRATQRLKEVDQLGDNIDMDKLNEAKSMALQDANQICSLRRQRFRRRLMRDLDAFPRAITRSISTRSSTALAMVVPSPHQYRSSSFSSATMQQNSSTSSQQVTNSNTTSSISRRRFTISTQLPTQALHIPPTMRSDRPPAQQQQQQDSASTNSIARAAAAPPPSTTNSMQSTSLILGQTKQSSSNTTTNHRQNISRRKAKRKISTPLPSSLSANGLIPLLLPLQEKGGSTDANLIHKRRLNALKAQGANYLITSIVE